MRSRSSSAAGPRAGWPGRARSAGAARPSPPDQVARPASTSRASAASSSRLAGGQRAVDLGARLGQGAAADAGVEEVRRPRAARRPAGPAAARSRGSRPCRRRPTSTTSALLGLQPHELDVLERGVGSWRRAPRRRRATGRTAAPEASVSDAVDGAARGPAQLRLDRGALLASPRSPTSQQARRRTSAGRPRSAAARREVCGA